MSVVTFAVVVVLAGMIWLAIAIMIMCVERWLERRRRK